MLFVPPAQEVLVRQPHFALGEALSARNPSRFRRRSVLALLKRSDQIRSDGCQCTSCQCSLCDKRSITREVPFARRSSPEDSCLLGWVLATGSSSSCC